MAFNPIDLDTWERREYFDFYMNSANCTYSITANIDITSLVSRVRAGKLKIYPTLIYIVSRAVNCNRNFRFAFNDDGTVGYWDTMSAQYPIFHEDDQTFSYIYTDYDEHFAGFYRSCLSDMAAYRDVKGMVTKHPPANSYSISCIPWVSFTGFNLNIITDGRYLSPIITWGKYFEQGDKILLPLSVQIHHAVADGYHTAQFINDVQHLATSHDEWLTI